MKMKVSSKSSEARKNKMKKKIKCSGSTPRERRLEEDRVETEIEALAGGAVSHREQDVDPAWFLRRCRYL